MINNKGRSPASSGQPLDQHRYRAMEHALLQIYATTNMISDMSVGFNEKTTDVAAVDVQLFCTTLSNIAHRALEAGSDDS